LKISDWFTNKKIFVTSLQQTKKNGLETTYKECMIESVHEIFRKVMSLMIFGNVSLSALVLRRYCTQIGCLMLCVSSRSTPAHLSTMTGRTFGAIGQAGPNKKDYAL